MDAVLLIVSSILGVIVFAVLSKILFKDFFPFPHTFIMDENNWQKILIKFIDRTRTELLFTTYAFSSVDFHQKIEDSLVRAVRRGVKIRIVGAQELMPEQRKRKLENLGCEITLVPKRMLDAKKRFYNHLLVSDGKHWIWLNPHPPEEKHVHFGSFEMYDYERAIKYRSEIVDILATSKEEAREG